MRGLSHWIEQRLGGWAVAGFRHPWIALAITFVLLATGLVAARNIRLSADLSELLPETFESVQGLERLKERFGGIGYVVVVGQGADPETLRRFADDLAPKLEALPGIRYVDRQRSTDFFAERGLYYLEVEDLQEILRRLREREKWERRQRNPLFLQLDDPGEAPALDFSDIEAKYRGAGSSVRLAGNDGERYYLDAEERMVVLLAKPEGTSADLGFSQRLLDSVNDLLARQDLAAYGPDFRVSLTGTFQKKIDQQKQIEGDVAVASLVAAIFMFAYLLFHFRSLVAVGIALAPVGLGLAVTYGFVGVAYGQVNLLTAFLGAILGGLGIEHGMHLLGRYQSLRRDGERPEEAVRDAFAHTGSSALVSALVASLTFLSIAISEFRAFREFGVIASVGMLVLVFAYFVLMPALLAIACRLRIEPVGGHRMGAWTTALGRAIERWKRPVAWTGVAAVATLTLASAGVHFDYDFGALEDGSLPSFVLDRKVNRILGHSQTPVVLLTESEEEERAAVAELQRRKERLGKASTIDFVASVSDLVPDRQEEKREILRSIGRILKRVDPDGLDEKTRDFYRQALAASAAEPFGREDLPAAIRRQFEGATKDGSSFVLVFPAVSMADGQAIRRLAAEVRSVPLPSGQTLSASGEAMVLADILEMVIRESPLVLAAALVSVIVAMWITLGSLATALLCLAPTIVSVLALGGVMAVTGLPFNYLNILVVPVLIGTTVDAGVHLMERLSERRSAFVPVYAETGRAIVGGLLTSAVGFGTLLLADHPGLNSVGRLAVIGFGINLVVMLAIFPAVLLLRRGGSRSLPVPTGSVREDGAF